jgi:hydroxyacylglutathione hydrolase
MHESANVNYDFEHVKDGDVLQIGNPRIRIIHTPGHTPESMSLIFSEYLKTSESILFTGDTLFRGNVGRLDLEGAGTSEQLYDSVKKLFSLDEFITVLPSHFGKSKCGQHKSPSGDCEKYVPHKGLPRCPNGTHRTPNGTRCEKVSKN